MKHLVISFVVAIFAFAGFVPDAEARRFGGGSSFGMQRQATPPSQPRQPAAAPQRPAQGAAAQQGGRSWMGPVAGLAAGLGLAALFSHLGLGEEFASFLLIALMIFAGVMLFRMFARRAAANQQGRAGQMQFATVGQGTRPDAAPQFHQPMSASAALAPSVASRHPDFDAEGFARQAKVNFIRLQAAHDEGNLDDIREFTTPEMFAEIRMQMNEFHTPGQRTDVVELHSEVIDVEEEDSRYVVSVRFQGLLREEANAAPAAFDEIWHLTKSKTGDRGWLIAGIQQLA
jgi:predicted lipid-binding transport protein (Tim44 family)